MMGSGSMAGAAGGAAIGSIIPGVGTLIGAAVGGAMGNMYDTNQAQKKAADKMKALQSQQMPTPTPMPTAADQNPEETLAQKQAKLKTMQYGFASTITNKPAFAAPLSTPSAQPLKSKFGQ